MRTTVIIPDDVVEQVRKHTGEGSLSRFVRESVKYRLEALEREAVVREMEAGYGAEAEQPSLDPEWSDLETDGW